MAGLRVGDHKIFPSPGTSHSPSYSDLGETSEDDGPDIGEFQDANIIQDQSTTRLVLQTNTFPPNNGTDGYNISGYLCHAKRSVSQSGGDWSPVANFDLRSMRAGEYVRIRLGPNNLRTLFLALAGKYQKLGGLESMLAEVGVQIASPDRVIIVEGKEREILQKLLENDSNFWDNVVSMDTNNVLEMKVLQEELRQRQEALNLFKNRLEDRSWSEGEWEAFFRSNEWIFGLGLTYHYLGTVQNQAVLGGTDLTGRGTDKVDYLMATGGDTRFTVLVDIKKPDANLLNSRPYRSNIFHIDKEIAGGVAQLQSYCHTWATEGSRINAPEKIDAYTYEPKGMLIVGDLAELQGSDAKKKSFELFRRHIHNPQILTFDEVYRRAEHLVAQHGSAMTPDE